LPQRLADEAGAYTDAGVGVRHAPDGTIDRTCTLDGQYMLSWFFKKRGHGDAPTVVSSATTKVARQPSARPATPTAVAKAEAVEDIGTDWPAQLGAARGDDVALLRIAQSAPVLGIKMAAVEALATENALRQAEREFRSHDRKVHRLAKQRLEAAVAQREARASAQTLLERTTALLAEAVVPINHVVDLDRDWEALPTHLLEPGQRERFAELRARLDAAIRERSDEQQRLRRWTADARRFLLEWQLVRLKAARERLIMELADLSERNERLFQGLGLPEAVNAEVESARLRVSNVWKELPVVVWESPAVREVGGYIAA
jgi:hypothetical protein